MTATNDTNSASQYFNDNWKKYQAILETNTLYHREMMAALTAFLEQHFSDKPFSLVDVGCGDASVIHAVLKHQKLKSYTGIDAAEAVLELAEQHFADIDCEKSFICGNMQQAIKRLPGNYNIIYTSYAVHHLALTEKAAFLQDCYDKLEPNGYLVLIDGILRPGQTRESWLDALANRIQVTQDLTDEQINDRMNAHSRQADFPIEIATYKAFASQQQWKQVQVLFEQDIFAFMLFLK